MRSNVSPSKYQPKLRHKRVTDLNSIHAAFGNCGEQPRHILPYKHDRPLMRAQGFRTSDF